jgi:hypothetical protein
MSEKLTNILKHIGESTREAVSSAELSRLGDQGRSELASALFTHNGFVLYGPGQDISKHEQIEVEAPQRQIDEQSRGMEM